MSQDMAMRKAGDATRHVSRRVASRGEGSSPAAAGGRAVSRVRRATTKYFVMAVFALAMMQAQPVAAGGAAKTANFMSWLKRNGGEVHGIGLKKFAGMGTGVVATDYVSKDQVVLSVPKDLCLSRDLLQEDPLFPHYRNFPAIDDAMVAWLLLHRAIGDKSRWAPYFRLLPREVPICQLFSDEQMRELQTPPHEEHCERIRKREVKSYASFGDKFAQLATAWLDSASLDGASEKRISQRLRAEIEFSDYMWGKTMLWSRAWMMQGKRVLVPMADMFNYQPLDEVRHADLGSMFLKYHEFDDDGARVLSDRACRTGKQLFEDYGDNRNLVYLENHGFVPHHNPFNAVPIEPFSQAAVAGHDSIGTERLRAAARLQIATGIELMADPRSMMPDNRAKLDLAARLVVAPDEVVRACLEAASADGCLDDEAPGNVSVLVPAVEAQLAAYPTTPEEDEALLVELKGKGKSLDQLAIRYRLALKRTLQAFVANHGPDAAQRQPDDEESAAASVAEPPHEGPLLGRPESKPIGELVDDFNEWVEAHRSEFPVRDIRVGVVPGLRIGAVAIRDIKAESVYITVAESAVMSEANAGADHELGPVLADLRRRFNGGDNFHAVLLQLLVEAHRGAESKWAPYVALLPFDLSHNPVLFSERQLKMLEGSVLLTRLRTRIATIRSKWQKVKALIFEHYDLLKWVTYEDYLWAHLIVDSRSIWWTGGRHLVPLLDSINCLEVVPEMRVHSTDLVGDGAETRAALDFARGAPVYENYGQPNHVYMQYHGFILDDNIHDCVQVDLGSVTGEGSTYECLSPDKPHPPRVTQALARARPGEDPTTVLKEIFTSHLKGYSTSTADDERLLAKGGLGDVETTIVRFRLTEKRLLDRLLGRQGKAHDEL